MSEQTITDHQAPIAQNPNIIWAQIFVDALASAGLTAVCLAPGSRSTPLTLAFAAHPNVAVHRHLDERSAGFFALGMAIAADKPVALLCTSGTAVANFLPAIVEANMSQVPLLILTADRPPELRHSGANQTIDQVKIFGDQVLWSVDAALPQADAPAVVLRNLRTLAARAVMTANGLRKGPVHLNFPFRKPLEPIGVELDLLAADRKALVVHVERGSIALSDSQINGLKAVLAGCERGVIVCGPRCPGGDFPQAVAALSCHLGYPILADPVSGMRFSEQAAVAPIISGYETFLQGDPGFAEPQVVIRFGAVPISKWLNHYLDRIQTAVRIHIRENGVWADDSHRTTHFIQANETAVCKTLMQTLPPNKTDDWVTAVARAEAKTWQMLEQALFIDYFDGAVVADVLDLLPSQATLFVGNSLPIRHLDQYGRGQAKPLFTYASRGASGIDGNISTALGVHVVRRQPFAAVLGDITFYHDLNGLLQVASDQLQVTSNDQQPFIIVLLNNDGGGIFNRLPVSQFDPPFTDLFLTPHGLDFGPAVRMYGLDFVRVNGREAFRQQFSSSLQDKTPCVIEVRTDNKHDETRRREINKLVQKRSKS